MTARKILTAAAALGLAALFVASTLSAVRTVGRQQQADRVCAASAERRWDEALARSEDLTAERAAASEEGRIAAECRCWALLASDRDEECTALMDAVLASAETEDRLPEPSLAKPVLEARLESGRAPDAAGLARRMTRAHPADPELLRFELRARSLTEGEDAVLRDLEARLQSSSAPSLPLRLVLADHHEQRGDAEAMLRVLGEEPPDLPLGALPPWFEKRAKAWALQGRQDRVEETYARWRALGGEDTTIDALYALQLSYNGLRDPDRSLSTLLLEALGARDEIEPVMVQALYERLIAHLLVDGETERALALYDEASERFDITVITREEIVRGASASSGGPGASETGTPGGVTFALPSDAPEGTLFVQRGPEAPPDAAYEALPLPPGSELRVARAAAATPIRWVFRDEEDRTRASGAIWPAAAGDARVRIDPGEAHPPDPRPSFDPGPADGRRRVFVLIPDCMDWRLVQYLRTRGELPVLDRLLTTGHRAVLESDPPLTAAAMESLVWPTRSRQVTLLGLVHRVGIELGGLASIGRNPLAFLAPLLPEAAGLFETVGAGRHVAANMLFSHGGIDAGQHAMLTGPHGRERRVGSVRGVRPLQPQERTRFPDTIKSQNRELIETTAAELDAAVQIAEEDTVDLLMLRVEPLDLITHGTFSELTRARQDDGESLLLDLYRYIDDRLAEVAAALDEDDILVVMSDHGIRTAMEHSKDAIFVAVGDGIPRGRAPGMPALHGVPRVLADLLSVDTKWPDTGIASWAAGPEAPETHAAAPPRSTRGE